MKQELDLTVHNSIPRDPGTYVLILGLNETLKRHIGKLGECGFPQGYYAYVGSALGSGGLAGRVARHLRPNHEKKPHWHIDHLSSSAEFSQVWWRMGIKNVECIWAQKLARKGKRLVTGFGSSDCRCPGHLIWFPNDQEMCSQDFIKDIGDDLRITHIHSQPS